MKKKSILISVLVGCFAVASAINPVDSIRQQMKHLKNKELLQAHSNLCAIVFALDDSIQELNFLNTYIQEAHKQGNLSEEAFARNSKLVCYYNYNMTDQLTTSLPKELVFFAEHKLWSSYYDGWSILIDLYIYQNKYQTALQEVEKMYADARKRNSRYGLGVASYSMGDVYHHMQNTNEASRAYDEAIRLLSNENEPTVLMYAYENYSEVLIADLKYEKLKKLCVSWRAKLDALKNHYKSRGEDVSALDCKYRYYHLAMACLEMETGHMDASAQHLLEAEKLTERNASIARLMLLRDYSRHYELKKEYDKALACNEERIQINLTNDNYRGLLDAREQRAELLMSAGRYAEAAHIYQAIIPVRDSLMSARTVEQLNELNTLYKVDELTLQKKLTTSRFYFALVCSVLLFVLVIIYIIYARRLRRKNRILYDTIAQTEKAQAIIWNSMVEKPEEQLEADERLFKQLCKLMSEEQLFKDSDLKREMLAAKLNTNRTYLADAVKKYADDATLTEFINEYRLRYAAAMLTNDPLKSVSEVELLSGFNSRSTFSRLFRDYYGMSPSEYRAISKEKKVESTSEDND
jgi:AraC-like DNA-binding protein